MQKLLLISICFMLIINVKAQNGNESKQSIGLAIPVIWNNSKVIYYTLGRRNEPSGKTLSYGLNIKYSKSIKKNIYGVGGIGIFEQSFNITRPFDFIAPDGTKPLVATTKYSYSNFHFALGIGYQKKIKKLYKLNGELTYNFYQTFRQKYYHNYSNFKKEETKKHFKLGNAINIDIGIQRSLSKNISLGFDAICPFYVKWNIDNKFINNYYSSDEQKVAINKFSIGGNINFNYHF